MDLNNATEQTRDDAKTANTEVAQAENVAMRPAATTAPVANPMNGIAKQYWNVTQLEVAQATVNTVMETVNAASGIMKFNFDPEKDFPEGFGLAVVPICKKDDSGAMQTLGAAIGAIPDYSALVAVPEGMAFAQSVVETALMAKLANAVRPRADGNVASSIPESLEDFITSNRPEGVLVAFRKLAGAYVKLLKGQGLKLMTDGILRSVLESAAFAESQFPKVPQASWEALLDSMIARAEKDGMQAGMLVDWRKDRDNAGLPTDEDVDLSGLDFSKI